MPAAIFVKGLGPELFCVVFLTPELAVCAPPPLGLEGLLAAEILVLPSDVLSAAEAEILGRVLGFADCWAEVGFFAGGALAGGGLAGGVLPAKAEVCFDAGRAFDAAAGRFFAAAGLCAPPEALLTACVGFTAVFFSALLLPLLAAVELMIPSP